MTSNEPYILMLESDPDDRFVTESSLEEQGISVDLRFVTSSTELIQQLNNPHKPLLVLMNFNSRPISALELIPLIKKDVQNNHIPLVVLGENISEEYVRNCYKAGAASFIMKPASVSETSFKIKTFFEYWLKVAQGMSFQPADS